MFKIIAPNLARCTGNLPLVATTQFASLTNETTSSVALKTLSENNSFNNNKTDPTSNAQREEEPKFGGVSEKEIDNIFDAEWKKIRDAARGLQPKGP